MFEKKDIYKYTTWVRQEEERVVDKVIMNYEVVVSNTNQKFSMYLKDYGALNHPVVVQLTKVLD